MAEAFLKMMNNIQAWAGNLNEAELEAALPTIWAHYVQLVEADQDDSEPAVEEQLPLPEPEEHDPSDGEPVLVDLDEMTPVRIINRPDVPADAPKSPLQAPAARRRAHHPVHQLPFFHPKPTLR